MANEWIVIAGAREHNLKNITVRIPRNRLTVITGLSGSGKSSLAFDTLYAEGQRKYVESLSAYARQFLEQMQKPDVDYIEGLSPGHRHRAAHGRGQSRARSWPPPPRSTTTCACCTPASAGRTATHAGGPISRQSAEEIVEQLLAAAGTAPGSCLLAPLVRGRKGAHEEVFEADPQAGLRAGARGRRAARARRGARRWTSSASTPSRWWWTAWSSTTRSAPA